MSSLKEKTASGLIWGAFSNGMVQVLGAAFGVLLLKLLDPSDHGRIAGLLVFSNIAGALQESGFTAALANKQEPSHEEYNAVFWFNILMGLALYIILFLAAPFIARFYHDPVMTPLARFAFLGFVVAGFGTAHRAYLFGHLRVRQTSIMQLTAITVSGVVGVVLAYLKFAYWGLAVQSVLYIAVMTVMAWHYSAWRPTLPSVPSSHSSWFTSLFSLHVWGVTLRPAWQMFGFSSKLLVNNLALQLNNNAFGVLLNRFFGSHPAGIYSSARKWNDMAASTINGMIYGVAQPVLRDSAQPSNQQGMRIVPVFRKLLRFTCFVSFPALLGLALIAEDFIVCLTGEKWRASAQLMQLLCLCGAFAPLVTLYSNLVISRGRSTVNMVVGLVNCALIWAGIIVIHAMGYGLRPMVVFFVILNISWLFVWQWWAKYLIGLRWRDALKDILPFFCFAAAVMLLAGWLTTDINNGWWRMAVRIPLAALLYVGLLWVARARILKESIQYIRHKGIKE